MAYKIIADSIVMIHFAWILFMITGFILTIRGFYHKEFFDRWLFRTIHFIGIAYVSLLAIMGKYCPLTLWENALRAEYDSKLTYPGSFIIQYTKRLAYPDINPWIIIIPTIFIAVFTIVVFILKPPAKVKKMLKSKR